MPICKPHTLADSRAALCAFGRSLAFWADACANATCMPLSRLEVSDP